MVAAVAVDAVAVAVGGPSPAVPVPGPAAVSLQVLARRGGRGGPGVLQHQPGLPGTRAQAGAHAGQGAAHRKLQHRDPLRVRVQAADRQKDVHRGHSNQGECAK